MKNISLKDTMFRLAKVADDYVAYVKTVGDFPLSESAQFVLIASTLLLIKSKSLLPNLELSEDEKGNIADLERRLALYKIIYFNAKF